MFPTRATATPSRYPNEHSKLFINLGGDRFRYVKSKFDYGPGPGARCAEKIDFDQDGWDDLLTCGADHRTRSERAGAGAPGALRLFRNRHGHKFADVTDRLPQLKVHDAVVGDIDGDHDPDLVFASRKGFYYSLNTDGDFGRAVLIGAAPVGVGRAVAVGDADHDGDLDVFGVVGYRFHANPRDRLYRNNELTFRVVVAPRARGTADEVIAVHPGRHGRADFLVMNGYHSDSAHPNVQLLRLVR